MALTFCYPRRSESGVNGRSRHSALPLDLAQAAVGRLAVQCLFNAQQLVVLGHAVGTTQGTGLDLTSTGRHRQIGNGGVLSLSGAVGNDSRVTGVLGHLDGIQGFTEAADLIELDQDGIANALVDPLLQDFGVGDEQIVAYQLDLAAQLVGQHLPCRLQ